MLPLPDPPVRKQDESWARNEEEKAETFATHLSKIFKPNPCEITLEEDNKLLSDNTTPAIPDTTYKTLCYQRRESRNKKSESKEDAGLRPHNQSNTAEAARNGNRIHQPTM